MASISGTGALSSWFGRKPIEAWIFDRPVHEMNPWEVYFIEYGIPAAFFGICIVLLFGRPARSHAAVGVNMQSEAAATVPEQPACPTDTDTELQLAIYKLAHRSAWGRCFSAQHLAIYEDPVEEIYLMQAAAKKVSREAMSGRLTIRGRPNDGIDYESIPREHWRSVFLDVTPDMVTPWKVSFVACSEVDPSRIGRMLKYDSLMVNAREFERLSTKDEPETDKARKNYLKLAKKNGIDPSLLERLS